jgi:hypothetical protein
MSTGYDDPLSGTERHRAVQRALADALRLARLQTEILARLEEADRAGDDEAVLCCHAELDHVMARIAETEQVRTGARVTLAGDDLVCAGCGSAAEPVYQQPRLLGFQCSSCGWSGDDPAAQADRKRAEALDAAAAAIGPAVQAIGETVTILGQRRGKQARNEGISALRELQEILTAVDQRLRRAQPA